MNTDRVKIIASEITGEEAARLLTSQKRFSIRRKSLQKLELVHLPYYVFTVELSSRRGIRTATISVDGIQGSFALFDQQKMAYHKEAALEGFDFVLSEAEAQAVALSEYRRMLLGYELKRRDPVLIKRVVDCLRLYYPYWIGYFLKRGRYDFAAIDALSGQKQGVKLRKVLLMAFKQGQRSQSSLQADKTEPGG